MIRIDVSDSKTYRNVVVVDEKPLVVADYRAIGPDPLVGEVQVADQSFSIQGTSAFTTAPVRGVVHVQAERTPYAEDLFEEGLPDRPGTILLQASTSPAVSEAHKLEASIVWLSMKDGEAYRGSSEWLPEFLGLSFEDAATIAQASDRNSLAKFEDGYRHLLDITHPGDPTAPLAFRLLCEAWAEVHDKGRTSLSDLPITAPQNLSDWLAPFVRAEGRPATIEEVVALMVDGDFKGKVRAVLEAKDGEALKMAVRILLGRADDPICTEGGAE